MRLTVDMVVWRGIVGEWEDDKIVCYVVITTCPHYSDGVSVGVPVRFAYI